MKQTEVGLIPDDWEVKKLGDLFEMKAGGDVDKNHFSFYINNIFKYKIFSNGLENEGIYGYTDLPKYKGNAITITGRGTVGVSMYRNEDFDAVIRLLVLNSKQEKSTNNFFISELINSIVKFPNESTGVPQLTVPQIKDIQIPLPPLAEQQRIAKTLSDVDAVISTTEKLIQKKKNIKQGTMQQLLSGKKRLPGFAKSVEFKQTDFGIIPVDWKLVSLNSLIADISDGPFGSNLKTEHYTNEKEARIIQLSNVGEDGWNDENTKYTTYLHAQEIKRCIVPYGSIVVAKMMPAGRAIICPNVDKMYVLGSDCVRISPNTLLDSLFFVYFAKTSFYLEQIKDNTQGSTRARTSVSKLKTIQIALPPKAEQTAIANILSSMDKEIETLNTKLEKYRNLKTAMMQQLLTGKIRLF